MTIDIDAWHREIREQVLQKQLKPFPRAHFMDDINAEVARRLAARVVEEAAKVCEALGPELIRWWGTGQANAATQECATAIRALIGEPKNG